MPSQPFSRAGLASGAVFAVLLFGASGDGSYNPVRAVLSMFALSLAIPFICALARVLRSSAPDSSWLVDTAVAAGVGGIVLKIASVTPELAMHRANVAAHTPMHHVLTAMGDGATVLCLFPLGIFTAATAVVAVRGRALPRWLAVGTGVTSLSLFVNGCFLKTSFVPALLVFALWTLLTSLNLVLGTRKQQAVRQTGAPALQH
jgi:hypothetical protein